jgi:hypothetical protein
MTRVNENIKLVEIFSKMPDFELFRAANLHLNDYLPDAQKIILKEYKKRNLSTKKIAQHANTETEKLTNTLYIEKQLKATITIKSRIIKNFEKILPSITDKLSAKKAAKHGIWASLFCSCTTILVVFINAIGLKILEVSYLALIDAVIFGIIAFGIYKMSRSAAIIGLVYYLYGRISMYIIEGSLGKPYYIIIFIIMFINSIRGTFLYHKYKTTKIN